MTQNTSHAVMAQRHEAADSADFFPTPWWATRALCEWLIGRGANLRTCWEPACGQGDMVKPLREYFGAVCASDVIDYGFPDAIVHDFVNNDPATDADFIITNPPFNLAAEFALKALSIADVGVCLFVRTAFLEGANRHRTLFSVRPPAFVLQFVERVPLQKGRLNPKGSTATAYCWIVWANPEHETETRFEWIAPCRKRLERTSDYPREAAE